MRILWLTWKDMQNPLAGGAEVVASELAKRLVAAGHEVIFVVGGFPGAERETTIDGYHIIRVGGRTTVYWHAYRYIKKHLLGWPELVIEEVNTIPFFSRFYLKDVKRKLFFHMLCREIWFYQMVFPFSLIGYLVEPFYLRVLRRDPVITISESTKQDLIRHGFQPDNIQIISEGLQIAPVDDLAPVKKYDTPTMLSFGALRAMKRTLEQVKAFEIAKQSIPALKLKIAGDASDPYGQKVLRYIEQSPYRADIEVLGRVSQATKQRLMRECHCICVTSIKEGWGLTVTEAASQGTPAVVYNVDGLRDSVRNNETGLVCTTNTPEDLASKLTELFANKERHHTLQYNAWTWSKQLTFEQSYRQFISLLQGD
jgi:glycosyltransferase involved in cell wall biosynthesis